MRPCPANLINLKVYDLLDPCNRSWNFEVVDRIFTKVEAVGIKQIPLSKFGRRDLLTLSATRNRCYSVKSGYHFLKNQVYRLESDGLGGENVDSHRSAFWQRFWKASLPPKVKMFVWRLNHEILPVKVILQKRKTMENSQCTRCNMTDEIVIHAVRDCTLARDA
ncbi:hypothetical protein PTKIN_Ptkin04bG0200800 [Pterospermum kingtungense]